ncbi:MAG: hypothetical protein Ct9H90mP2_01590 [Dehalococcoidia bacterium]|nr:MAG: hypothetical protein Ct9H90mP2_01590 [Dehalococcoidia bacterium]
MLYQSLKKNSAYAVGILLSSISFFEKIFDDSILAGSLEGPNTLIFFHLIYLLKPLLRGFPQGPTTTISGFISKTLSIIFSNYSRAPKK